MRVNVLFSRFFFYIKEQKRSLKKFFVLWIKVQITTIDIIESRFEMKSEALTTPAMATDGQRRPNILFRMELKNLLLIYIIISIFAPTQQ